MVKNSSNSKNKNRKTIKAVTFALSFVFVFSVIITFIINYSISVKAEETPPQTYYIRSVDDFRDYSDAYKRGLRNKDDVLIISINQGSAVTGNGFISIGTEDNPFSGTLNIPTAGRDVFHLFDCPLFDYVSTKMKITGTGIINIIREKLPETPAVGALTSGALFANHVVNEGGAASWEIHLLAYDGEHSEDESSSYEGLIGDIAANSNVTVTFNNMSNIEKVSGNGNIGLICGTLNSGATLNVTTSGSGANISVESTGGHAGGLVGEMKSESTLKFNSANNSRVTSVTSTSGFAGGVVGYADNITLQYDTGITDYAVSGIVNGDTGAGGVFGYYKNTDSSETFTLKDTFEITSGMDISSTAKNGYAGGVFGLLENNGASFIFDGNKDDENVDVVLSKGTNRGGICGGYKTSALTNTFEIKNTAAKVDASANNSAGLIGTLKDSASYVNIHDVTCTSNGTLYGGVIGNAGDKGSFIDMTGNITVSCDSGKKIDAGLVGNMPEGVLRLKGTFDLSGFIKKDSDSGFIVKDRDRALVYALGDGSGSVGDWTFKRNTNNTIDDIHSWGEVVRMDGTILKESDLVTVNPSAHTVTVAGAVATMSTVTDFTKTALNISLNTENGKGALQFTPGDANKSSTLLADTLSLGADIDLAGTGITGLTRDNGANAAFSGTFNGDGYSITFATGENYGLQGNGSALDANSSQGNIHQHTFNGLFAQTSGATIENVTLSGNFYINQTTENVRLGGVTAYATYALTIENVTTDFTGRIKLANSNGYYAGAVGAAAGTGLDITVNSSTLTPTFNDISTAGSTNAAYFSAAIGLLNAERKGSIQATPDYSPSVQSVQFTSTGETKTNLGLTYTCSNPPDRATMFGAAIGSVTNCSYVKDNRRISFDDIDVDVAVTGGKTRDGNFGAILGVDWYAADVTIDDVRIDSSISASGSAADFGGLVRTATGHWDVKNITLNTAAYALPDASGSTFGFIANKTSVNDTNAKSTLYLDVDNTGTNYNISALTFTNNSPTFTVYDEIVAYSCFYNGNTSYNDITNNGNSIISITTSDDIINTSDTCNTYLNKTTYGQSANYKINPNTRYYYNVNYARGIAADINETDYNKYNFYVWSLKTYAHNSLAAWFPSTSTFTGDLDMTGISYYPVDLTESVTFGDGSTATVIKLDNVLMEDYVKYAYTGADGRTTRSNTNQHYLMHTALFRNDGGSDITLNTVTLQGNVPKISDSFCGFVVAGMIGNSENYNVKFNGSTITLDGVHIVTDAGEYLTNNAYAPLLINKIGKKSSLTLDGVSQSKTAYSSYASNGRYAASSLIGNVGSNTARAIYLDFSDMKLDGRSTAGSIGNMDTVYGTTRSVFSRATFLNSFLYAGESSGTYNYYIEEDWTNSTTPVHNVTYGKEVTDSVEFLNKQKMYSVEIGQTQYYTHPTTYQSGSEYSFSSGFLPHVYVAYNLSESKHEIAVNVSVTAEIQGCGKYNDPYIIDDDTKLPIISKIIHGGAGVADTTTLYLPNDLENILINSSSYTATGYTKYKFSSKISNSQFIDAGNATPQSAYTYNAVREYLAGAYYVITKDIKLDNTYIGLGETISNDNANQKKYVFRGVIIGRDITITNESVNPLIHTSVGSVVKDLTVKVDVKNGLTENTNYISLAAPTGSNTYEYLSGIQTYGAVIGQILGGDNIIDNVKTVFTNVHFDITGADNTTNYERLTPIGGYVGSLVNGGLIFRNMVKNGETYEGLTDNVDNRVIDDSNDSTDNGYLYINPYIGRVIAGYAFYETNDATYSVKSTLDNGNKNYVISDLTTNGGKLTINYSSNNYTIDVPDGQAMYLLGAIINSGAAAAKTSNGTSAYDSTTELAYDGLTDFWQAYRAYTTVRGGSGYSSVGLSNPSPTGDDAEATKNRNDYNSALNDKYSNDGSKVPYIIRKYTVNKKDNAVVTNRVFYARYLGKITNNSVSISNTCDVAAGFRGIGNLFYDSDYLRLCVLSVSGATGNSENPSYTVTLHMDFRQYEYNDNDADNVQVKVYQPVDETAGFGLFNVLKMNGASETNSINNIVLAGSVFYDIYTLNGTQSLYNHTGVDSNGKVYNRDGDFDLKVSTNQVSANHYISVGGITGLANKSLYYIKDVTFNNFNVEGAKGAGGLIGFSNYSASPTASSYIKYSTGVKQPGYVKVVGGIQAGGLIGRIYCANTEIIGDENGGTDINIRLIELKSAELDAKKGLRDYPNNQIIGAGGLIGNVWAIDKESSNNIPQGETRTGIKTSLKLKKLLINNINVVGQNEALVQVKNDTPSVTAVNAAGGFIGVTLNSTIKITDCKLTNVNVKANRAGGIIGFLTQKYFVSLENVTLDGNDTLDENNTHSIIGRQIAGGVFGYTNARDDRYIDINTTTVKNYTIESTCTANNVDKCAAGGIFGAAIGDDKKPASWIDGEIRNTEVYQCTIKTNYTNKNSVTNCGTGGIIGLSTINNNFKFDFCGYNVMIDNVTLQHLNGGTTDDSTSATNRKIGDIIGNNSASSDIRLVGATTANMDFCGKHAGYYNNDNENYGTNGYVVFADYGGVASITNTTGHVVIDDTTSNNAANDNNKTNVTAELPYVTINPYISASGFELSSDGAAYNLASLPIKSIITDSTTGRYKYAADSFYTGNSGDKNLAIVNSNISKFEMLHTEVSYNGPDFPVLVLDGTESTEGLNKLLTAYIRMLTNTKYEYGDYTKNTDKYEIQIYKMTFDGENGVFVPSLMGTSLKRATRDGNNVFYRDSTLYDSGKEQFTLIDVRFLDPGKTDETAYHLYIPVFVKKVLQYTFDIAELSGTSYLPSLYESRFGQALIENSGTPVTVYFRYTYSRTRDEWQAAIEAGENVADNYNKTLLFYKANTNDIIDDFGNDTILVLVDPNDNCKPYYAKFGDAFNPYTRKLDLSVFRETMTPDGNGGYTFSGGYFSPQDLSELMNISATQNNASGKFVRTGENETPTVNVKTNNGTVGYRLATDQDTGDKYDLTIDSANPMNSERYYLSIYTQSNAANDELFHYYLLKTPSSFSGTDQDLPPAKIYNSENLNTMAHLVMGKIFYHSDFVITSYSDDPDTPDPIMKDTNRVLNVNLSSQIGLSEDLETAGIKENIKNLVIATDVFQSFLIYLNRKENGEIHKAILGTPTGGGNYYIDYDLNKTEAGSATAYNSGGDIRITQNYAEFVTGDISSFFDTANIDNFEINSEISLTYSTAAVPTQFPGRSEVPPADDNGVTVSGASNIAFSSDATTYSKNTIEDDDSRTISYYSESPPEVATLDLSPMGNREGDFTPLGINALNIDDATTASFDILPTLNISAIIEDLSSYSYDNGDAYVTVQLQQRQNDGSYGEALDMSVYFTSLSFGNNTVALNSNADTRTVVIPASALTFSDSAIVLPTMQCTVKTGTALQNLLLTYGNYKITVTVVIRDNNGNRIPITQASNYVIYTNAKVIPKYID